MGTPAAFRGSAWERMFAHARCHLLQTRYLCDIQYTNLSPSPAQLIGPSPTVKRRPRRCNERRGHEVDLAGYTGRTGEGTQQKLIRR